MWIQIHSENGFGFSGKSNGLDSWVLSEVTSLLFVYVCDTNITSGFTSESTLKRDSSDSRIPIQIRALNGRICWIWKIWIRIRQIEYAIDRHQRTKPRPLVTFSEDFVTSRRVVFEISEQTDIQMHSLQYFASLLGQKKTKKNVCKRCVTRAQQ